MPWESERCATTRRHVLKQMAGAGVLIAGSTVLVACGAGSERTIAPTATRTTVLTADTAPGSTASSTPPAARSTMLPTATAQASMSPTTSTSAGSLLAPTPQATAVVLA